MIICNYYFKSETTDMRDFQCAPHVKCTEPGKTDIAKEPPTGKVKKNWTRS